MRSGCRGRRQRSNGGASIADYVIQRSSNGGGGWRTVADGASTSRNVTIGGLTNGTRYHFPRVAAKNRVGVGAWSGTASASPAGMDPPSNPEDDGSIAAAGYTGIGTYEMASPCRRPSETALMAAPDRGPRIPTSTP